MLAIASFEVAGASPRSARSSAAERTCAALWLLASPPMCEDSPLVEELTPELLDALLRRVRASSAAAARSR